MPTPPSKSRIHFLLDQLSPFKARLSILFAFLCTGIVIQMYSPRYIQLFIDRAGAGAGSSVLLVTALLFLTLTIARQLLTVVVQALTSDLTWKVTNQLRLELTRLCLKRELEFYRRHTPGELVERIDGDVGRLNNFLSAFLLKVVGNHLLIAGIVIAVYILHPLLGAVVFCCSSAALLVLHRMGSYGTATVKRYMAQSAKLIGYLDETISGREDIRALNSSSYALSSYYRGLRLVYPVRKQTGKTLATVLNTGDLTLAAVMAVMILTMGLLSIRGSGLTLGTMFQVYFYITLLLVPLRNIVGEISDLQQAGASADRVRELLDHADGEAEEHARPYNRDDTAMSVRFDNVTFGYDATNPVLQGVSFYIPQGRSIGIIGKSGSGKTTIARLLFRLCDTQQGTIAIGGSDIRSFRRESLRSAIAFVPQHVELFEGTLRDNIAMFDTGISDEQIVDAITVLQLEDWLKTIPGGFDKRIERDGGNLSAGEAQLIAFARAFLRRPDLVILDEATSRLDSAAERKIGKAIRALTRDRTSILIAHRLSTVERADYVLLIRNGQMVEFGETALLSRDPSSEYAKLRREAGAGIE